LTERLDELPHDRAIAAVCKGGQRSGLAASILQREGFDPVIHVGHGGIGAWKREGHPIETGAS
jgi:hydroxyacylglutathione hydrolase